MNLYIFPKNPLSKSNPITQVMIILGGLFFIVSLFQTALFTSGDDIYGYWILILGWMGVVIFQLSWFANILNILAIMFLLKRPSTSFLLSLLAFILASQTLLFSEIPVGLHEEKIFIKELGLGFYFWYFSQGLIMLSALIEIIFNQNRLSFILNIEGH